MTWSDFLRTARSAADIRLFDIGGTTVTVSSVVTFAVIMVVTFWFSWLFQRIVARGLTRGGMSDPGTVATIRRLFHYVILIAGAGIALQTVGISLASVFAAGAVVAVGVGFALQNILQNFVSGMILLAERSIREGDVLEVEGELIRVARIGTRSTVARTLDDDEVIIPNSILVQGAVKNYTLSDAAYRIRTTVGVSYGSDMKRVEEVLVGAATDIEGRLITKDPVIFLKEFADSSVVWEVSVWTDNPWRFSSVRSALNKAIWWALKDASIVIAFPQLDLHVQSMPVGEA